jgi:prophage regulatory protein
MTETSASVPSNAFDPLQLLDVNDLSRLFKRSPASLWRDHSEGRLPAGLKIGRAVRWRRVDIEAWLLGQSAEQSCIGG